MTPPQDGLGRPIHVHAPLWVVLLVGFLVAAALAVAAGYLLALAEEKRWGRRQ